MRVAASGVLLLLFAMLVFVPWRCVTKYRDYRGFHDDYARLATLPELRNALVLVHTDNDSEYASAFLQNAPTLDGDRPVFARALSPDVTERLVAAFPGRRLVHVDGRSGSRHRARVRGSQ
jgi:hypothetical protein